MWWTQLSLTWIKGWDGCSLHTFKSNYAKIRNIQKADQEADDSAPSQENKDPKLLQILSAACCAAFTSSYPSVPRHREAGDTHFSKQAGRQ